MKFIIGEKQDMTHVWEGDKMIAVTRVKISPCTVLQIKTDSKDGYSAIQFGAGEKKAKNIRKPQLKHYKGLGNFKYVKEARMIDDKLAVGDVVNISSFVKGDKVTVISTSKGKGFQGVVRRHGFKGHKATHGTKDQVRMSGSVGATGPAHLFKGMRMAGRMGNDRVTIPSEIIDIDETNSMLLIKGGVSGSRNTLVLISAEGELAPIKASVKEETLEKKSEKKKEEVVETTIESEVVGEKVEEKNNEENEK